MFQIQRGQVSLIFRVSFEKRMLPVLFFRIVNLHRPQIYYCIRRYNLRQVVVRTWAINTHATGVLTNIEEALRSILTIGTIHALVFLIMLYRLNRGHACIATTLLLFHSCD